MAAALGMTVGVPRAATTGGLQRRQQARPSPRGQPRLVCRAAASAPPGSATRLSDAFKATLARNQCVHCLRQAASRPELVPQRVSPPAPYRNRGVRH